jgi:tetratricopeptide (TPR) repeat protein
MNELANAYLRVGRPLDAVPLLEEGRRLSLNKPTAPQHTKFAILMNLSTAYQRTGRTKQAVEVSRELFELRKTSLGAGHRDPLSDMIHTADLLVAINEFQQAEALLVECRTLAIEHGHLVEKRLSIQGLVHLYDRSNQPAKAEESFRELSPELQLRFALVRQNAWPLLWGWPRF